MSEAPGVYKAGDRLSRPQPPPTFEIQLGNLPLRCAQLRSL
jgi:hypothetical protein